MSSLTYNLSDNDGRQTLAVFGEYDGTTFDRIVTRANPAFETLVLYLATTDPAERDVEYVHGLVDPAVGIGRMLAEEFGGRITFDLHHFYIDGIPEVSACAKIVRDKVLNGDVDWKRMVRFLVRLEGNPSKRAKEAIWQWVEKHGVSITEDGRIAGFKGLVNGKDEVTGEENIPVSYHAGPNNFIDGVLYGEPGQHYQVPHRVGTVISKRRADVDDNTNLACSTGLHVGAYSYAKTFGENRADGARYSTMGRMADSLPNSTFAIVVFAPEDVVSVPSGDDLDWKIRVSKYEVSEFLETVEDVLKDKPIYDVKTPAPFIPEGESYSPEPEVEQPPTPIGQTEVETPSSDDDGNEYSIEPEAEQVVPSDVKWFEIYSSDNLGDTIYETISGTEDDAEETAEGYRESGTEVDWREVEEEQDEAVLVEPEKGTGLLGRIVLRDWAAVNPALAADLENRLPNGDWRLGHKAVARKYEAYTTEASVRRYRKNLEG